MRSFKRQSLRRRTMKRRNKVKNKRGAANPVYSMSKKMSFARHLKRGY